jgi:hypothetical protein
VGSGDGVGVEPSDGPSQVARTTTLVAFVVVPSTGIAPFSNVVPSWGWLTVRVGAWITRYGTLMISCTGASACLPVSGSSASM